MEMVMKRNKDQDVHKMSESFCERCVKGPCKSFGMRCNLLAKEQRSRFYILRRCITMLVCWHE
ncbi:hypothetical protein QQ045_004550 [Rhodiola kirilowii]